MNPTKQTILHDPDNGKHGNCLSAVLASLLHKPIEEVPLFIDPDTWVKDLNTWLRQFGLAYFMVDDFDCHVAAYGIAGLWHEISGNTNRSKEVIHACVAKDSSVVFDPHPDDTGLTKITSSGVFMVLEPWKYSEQADEIAALRQQLEEAQSRNDFIDEAAARIPVDTLLIARAELAEAECAARDEIIERLEQRLANAEAQEPPTLRLLQPHKDENGLNVIDGPMGFRYPGTIELIARPLRPAPPATDERVKELEAAFEILNGLSPRECADLKTIAENMQWTLQELLESRVAALAASKGEVNHFRDATKMIAAADCPHSALDGCQCFKDGELVKRGNAL